MNRKADAPLCLLCRAAAFDLFHAFSCLSSSYICSLCWRGAGRRFVLCGGIRNLSLFWLFIFANFMIFFLGSCPKKREKRTAKIGRRHRYSPPLSTPPACTLSAMSVTSAVAVNCTHCDRNDRVSLWVCMCGILLPNHMSYRLSSMPNGNQSVAYLMPELFLLASPLVFVCQVRYYI